MASPRPETRYAKQLWLYGAGDGQPIKSIPKLAEVSGVTAETLRRYLPEWEKESESLLANTSELGLAINLSEETLGQHKKDMAHLRNLVEANILESEQLEKMSSKLEGWLDKFKDGDVETALRVFDAWQRSCGSKSQLQSQFLALQKQWTQLAGIVDLKDISVVRQKEIAKGQAKLTIKQLESETGTITRNVVASGVFARPVLSETGTSD